MATRRAFSLGKIVRTKMISAPLFAEIKLHMFSFSLLAFGLGIYQHYILKDSDFSTDSLIYAALGMFFIYCLLQHFLSIFINNKLAKILSIFPVIPVLLLLNEINLIQKLWLIIAITTALRLLLVFIPVVDGLINCCSTILLAATITVFLVDGVFKDTSLVNILMVTFLVAITISGLQNRFFEKSSSPFPFAFFIILSLLLAVIPMRDEPIDWTPVTETGAKIIEKTQNTWNSAIYYVSGWFGSKKYSTGYSTLSTSGGSIELSDTTQLILSSNDKPYFSYFDEGSQRYMVQARTLYLSGDSSQNIYELIDFANLLYSHDVDKDYAELFSKTRDLTIKYEYITTKDAIAPANTYKMLDDDGKAITSNDSATHQKGFILSASYLDIDYGSPYLTDLYRNPVGTSYSPLSYEDFCAYLKELFYIPSESLISKSDYDTYIENGYSYLGDDLDTTGATDRMKSLAEEITKGLTSDYDKCKAIESYLRQYPYSTKLDDNAVVADMNSAAGLSTLADSFLFESQEGYCVHFTSAMTMLLRLSGIPAHPVSGYHYVFPIKEDEYYKVSGGCAHTWPVAYIENIGWIPFEPTSTYTSADNRSWNKKAANTAEDSAITSPALPDSDEEAENIEPSRKLTVFDIAKIVAVIVICLAILLGTIFLGTKAVQAIAYRRGTPAEKLAMDVEQIKKSIRRLSKEDFADRGFLSDYVKRTPSYLQDDAQNVFDLYYKVKYGNGSESITPDDIIVSKELRCTLNNLKF